MKRGNYLTVRWFASSEILTRLERFGEVPKLDRERFVSRLDLATFEDRKGISPSLAVGLALWSPPRVVSRSRETDEDLVGQ